MLHTVSTQYFQLFEHKLCFWKASHQTNLPTESNDKHWIKCAFTHNTHTHLDTKEKQAETGEQQTHWQKERNSIYRDSRVYNFPPEGSRIHLCEDQILDRSLTSSWLEESEQRLQGYDSTCKWDGGIQERHQGHVSGCSLNHTRTGTVQTAQLRREKGPSISAAAHWAQFEFQFGQVICLLQPKMNCVLAWDLCSLQKCLWRSSIYTDTWDWYNM